MEGEERLLRCPFAPLRASAQNDKRGAEEA